MEIPEVPAIAHRQYSLSAPAYDLWVQGRLLEEMGIRDDGRIRVEIIGGEIVVSPGPNFAHGGIVGDVQEEFYRAKFANPDFPWRSAQNVDFNLAHIAEGYIPDLVILDAKDSDAARAAEAAYLLPRQIRLAVEVTSRWNAGEDREPGPRRGRRSKWNGYALVGVPFYLLIDRDPRRMVATLYEVPDMNEGSYLESREWEFGEILALPAPFSVEIPTDKWSGWRED